MSFVRNSIVDFLTALADRRTYSGRNPYLWFGFLWGLPVPFFSIGLDLYVSGAPFSPGAVAEILGRRPVHMFFAAHPVLFAVVFGAMGTIKLRQDRRIAEQMAALEAANERLRELDRMKKEFLANVTHELKTPLVTVLGYTEMMLDGRLGEVNERQKNGLAVALRNIERLQRLIEELLDVSRMEAGRLVLELRVFPLGTWLETAVREFEAEAARKKVKLEVSIADPAIQVRGDPDRLHRVVANLITNAVKFTEPGGEVRVRAGTPRDGLVEVAVRDTGRGIPEHFKPRLFERFSRADARDGKSGTGLGLSIVKAILDAHGAPITVESEEGRGTEVRFSLPVVPGPPDGPS